MFHDHYKLYETRILAAVVIASAVALPCRSETRYWTFQDNDIAQNLVDRTVGSWFDEGNWANPHLIPDPNDRANFGDMELSPDAGTLQSIVFFDYLKDYYVWDSEFIPGGIGTAGIVDITKGGWTFSFEDYTGHRGGLSIVDKLQIWQGTLNLIGRGNVPTAEEDASVVVDHELYVGIDGEATLNITNDARVLNSFGSYLGFYSGSRGTANVADATWETRGDLHVGLFGAGDLNVSVDGSVKTSPYDDKGHIYIGSFDRTDPVGISGRGDGTVTVSNGTLESSGYLYVGDEGTGRLDVENGGLVKNGFGLIGFDYSGQGTATVSGFGSTWENSGGLDVGSFGSGVLQIERGGLVTNTEGTIGFSSTSQGTAIVSGPGSTWENSGGITVGHDGGGELRIENGGVVQSGHGVVSFTSTSEGIATVTDPGSLWENLGPLVVGHAANGVLQIENGGMVRNTLGFLGVNPMTQGSATVTGDGSHWSSSDGLVVGSFGIGTLNIENGGRVESGDGVLGKFGGADGKVTVTGTGSNWSVDSSIDVGPNGTGILKISNGANVAVGSFVNVFESGELAGDGSITGSVYNGGLVSPGLSAGVLTIDGNYEQSSLGTLSIEIGGITPGVQFDQLDILGDVILDGLLDVTLIDGFVPTIGQQFEVLSANSVVDTGLTLGNLTDYLFDLLVQDSKVIIETLGTPLPGDFNGDGGIDGSDFLMWQRGVSPNPFSSGDLADWRANYGTTVLPSETSSAVPEPATWFLLMFGIMISLFRRDLAVNQYPQVMRLARSGKPFSDSEKTCARGSGICRSS